MKIQPCGVASNAEHGLVFVLSLAIIDYTPGKHEPNVLFVVVCSGHNRISSVFTPIPIEINYLHWASKILSQNNPQRAKVLQHTTSMDEGRQTLFDEYFGISKLSNAISELIPAVKSEGNVTDIFTRQASQRDSAKDSLLTDILMCTTAAPTYFPGYRLKNSVYVDGGVQANNPAMIAYNHTLNLYPNCDRTAFIRLLSLGTGDYVPDPLHPDASRNLLFWARNHQSVIKKKY
ncbi:unnamed protein product [Didymodactylos carnosus]|uniref:PNPLA domain-containing protein n=1 Tax=Didymodactylos carnosus TaxID=1234261 RepID=A0A815II90_9BILA|nr:unnamed protein product [Didymodactylos carnosus]CAF4247182.1 unnamed protein product [Didymodactylos carnosus]